jgi:hypothetical protein
MSDIGGYVTAEMPVKITDRKQTKKERIKQLEAELERAHSHATSSIVFVYEERIKSLEEEIVRLKKLSSLMDNVVNYYISLTTPIDKIWETN